MMRVEIHRPVLSLIDGQAVLGAEGEHVSEMLIGHSKLITNETRVALPIVTSVPPWAVLRNSEVLTFW
jgi:hypothetical protein